MDQARLLEALKNADAAGDTEAAQRIARTIRSARPSPAQNVATDRTASHAVRAGAENVGSVIDKAGTAAYRGLSYLAGAPAEIRSAVSSTLPAGSTVKKVYDTLNAGPTSQDARNFIFGTLGVPERDATSNLGKIAQRGFEGLSTVAFTGGTGLLPAFMGFGAGGGAEAAKQAFPNSKTAEFLGSLFGMLFPYGVSKFSPGVKPIVRDALKSVPASQVDDAFAAQRAGRAVGSPVTGPEALNSTDLLTLQRLAERTAGGGPLRRLMESRPATQQAAVQNVSRQISPSMPPRQVKQDLATASRGALDTVKAARTNAVSPFYRAAATESMPASVLDDVLREVDDQIARVGTESGIGRQLTAYKGKILSAIDDTGARVGPLDAIYKETREAVGKTKLQPGALDNEVKGVLGPINRQLGNSLSRGNENIAMGRAVYQDRSPAVNAMRASPVGDLVPRAGVVPTFKDQAGKLLSPENVRPDDVVRALRAVSRENPRAAPQWVAGYIDNTMDTAMKRLASGKVENAGGKFYTAIAGTPNARANIRAAFGALPQGSVRWRAFENVLKTFEAQSRRLPVGSATSENLAASRQLMSGASPRFLNWFAEALENARYGRNIGQLAELFARSDSVDELVRIANLKPGTRDAAATVGKFVALETQTVGRPKD